MTDADPVRTSDERKPEKFGIALDARQQVRVGELEVLQTGVHVRLAFGVDQSRETEATDEALDLAQGHRFLFQIDEVNSYPAFFKEPFGGTRCLRASRAENLYARHMALVTGRP